MKTTMLTKKDIRREWFLVDAKGKTVGRLASKIAKILQGKHKPEYLPHEDLGDFIVVINAKGLVMTGNKFAEKKYYKHTGYPGGLKETPAYVLLQKNPSKILIEAVSGMLPKTSLRVSFLKKLKVYNDEEHGHLGQSPKPLAL